MMYGRLTVQCKEDACFSEEQIAHFLEQGYVNDDHVVFEFNETTYNKPYVFADERYVLLLDGEIYNDVELQKNLETDFPATSGTITETVANLFLSKGVDAFADLRGRFSIFIWDKLEKTVYGARDRFGSKPLYYLETDEQCIFSTEKKEILDAVEEAVVNAEALQHYFTFQYVPEPYTLTENIYKAKPGHYFVKKMNEPIEFTRYFHATFQPVLTEQTRFITKLRETLIDSVQVHMRTDKQLGSLLSGGIDSSLVVALAKEINPKLKTFTVGFEQQGFSEIDLAAETAEELGVEHISHVVSQEEYVTTLPKIIWHMENPLADPSCVPLYFAAREAKKHVDGVLSGEGADELFGGYNIYREPGSLRLFQTLPKGLNALLHQVATIFPEGMKGKSFLLRGTTPLKDRYIGNAKMFEEADKQALLKQYDAQATYQTITAPLYEQVQDDHPVQQMQYIDIHTWLPGDILLKGSKMMRAHDLELRMPFLDKEVFNMASQIPVHENIADGTTKSLLRKAFVDKLPENVLYRKKLGFPVPIRHWLKEDDFYAWTTQLIAESETDELIEKSVVLDLLEAHRQGKHDYSRKIWTVLIFMIWHQVFVEKKYSFAENKAVLATV